MIVLFYIEIIDRVTDVWYAPSVTDIMKVDYFLSLCCQVVSR